MGQFGDWAADMGMQLGQGAIGTGLGLLLEKHNDKRQIKQERKLQDMQIQGQMEMGDYNFKKQMEMWNATNYPAQMQQLNKAGLNTALMYGMKGGGGITTGSAPASGAVGKGNAPSGGGETMASAGMAMQLGLLRAQKENIEADTANKKADIPVKGAQEKDLTASAEGKGLLNALTAWLQGTDEEGKDATTLDKSVRGKQEIADLKKTQAEGTFKLNEDERQKLMNSKVLQEIGGKISLMQKQGATQDEILNNLKKEGLLLDAEIEWNKLDLSQGNFGKFITNLLKLVFRPK